MLATPLRVQGPLNHDMRVANEGQSPCELLGPSARDTGLVPDEVAQPHAWRLQSTGDLAEVGYRAWDQSLSQLACL